LKKKTGVSTIDVSSCIIFNNYYYLLLIIQQAIASANGSRTCVVCILCDRCCHSNINDHRYQSSRRHHLWKSERAAAKVLNILQDDTRTRPDMICVDVRFPPLRFKTFFSLRTHVAARRPRVLPCAAAIPIFVVAAAVVVVVGFGNLKRPAVVGYGTRVRSCRPFARRLPSIGTRSTLAPPVCHRLLCVFYHIDN